MTESKVWRWGIMAPGTIARGFAAALRGLKRARFQAVASRSLVRAEAFAAEFGAEKAYGSYEEILADPTVDVVYISTQNPHHAELIRMALEAYKHVLCEKPFTLNHTMAAELAELAQSRELFLMEAMWTRFHPVTRTVVEWIEEGKIGEVVHLIADFGFHGSVDLSSRVIDLSSGGGALLDVGVYCVSYASMLFGKQPRAVTSLTDQMPSGVDLTNSLVFDYGEGRQARLSSSVIHRLPNAAVIVGRRGIIEVPNFGHPHGATLRLFGQNQFDLSKVTEQIEHEDLVNGFEYEILEVMNCLDQGLTESPLLPMRETVAILETMDKLRADWGLRYPGE